ncbi:MAG: 3-dehydroquinate synthase [Clostridiales bacterium 43-6]|nr:MAG: 3-dehydroquinate synthase [Clostridiales bacterium 43-6]
MKKKFFWFDARNLKKETIIMTLINNFRFENILINYSMIKKIKKQHKTNLLIEINNIDELSDLSLDIVVYSTDKNIIDTAYQKGYKTAWVVTISNHDNMDQAWINCNNVDNLVLNLKDETNIPVELLIAKLQNTNTNIVKLVNNVNDAEIAFGVMEVGCDGVLIQTEEINEISNFDKLIERKDKTKLSLVKVKVSDVQHIGMGHRVCVDTTSIMEKTEGMIIGSKSNGGLLVSSETHFLPYMELRPFRVNAGAICSYVLAPQNMTAYLSEIKVGSRLLCVDINGNAREVSVGRTKIEIRPLLKIEAIYDNITINTIVQDDWHIRIFGADGKANNASNIKIGDELLAYIDKQGRHVGIQINENINEN